jgi:ferredoxin-thioredoxin reductase catalytic subunit
MQTFLDPKRKDSMKEDREVIGHVVPCKNHSHEIRKGRTCWCKPRVEVLENKVGEEVELWVHNNHRTNS